jgi:hypothetical protein
MSALFSAFQAVVAGPALHVIKMNAHDGTPRVRMTHNALSGLYSLPFQLLHQDSSIPPQLHPDANNILIPEATLRLHMHVAIFRIPFTDQVSPTDECWVPVNKDLRAMLLDGSLDPSSYHIAKHIVTQYSTHQSMYRLPFLNDKSILQAHLSLFVESTRYYTAQSLTPKICVYQGHGSVLCLPMTTCLLNELKERFTADFVTYTSNWGAKVFIDCTALDALPMATTAPPSMSPNWTWMDWHAELVESLSMGAARAHAFALHKSVWPNTSTMVFTRQDTYEPGHAQQVFIQKHDFVSSCSTPALPTHTLNTFQHVPNARVTLLLHGTQGTVQSF